MEWSIDYDNDTGPNDDYFHEWWVVTNGSRSFKCNSQEDADWLCNLLNLSEKQP